MVALAVLLPIGSILPWKRGKLEKGMRHLWAALALSVASGALVWAIQTGKSALAPIGVILAVWIVLGACIDLLMKSGRGSASDRLRRVLRLPKADWGRGIAHSGFGITIFGIAALMAWEVEDDRVAQLGEPFEVSGYQVTLENVARVQGPNYVSTTATMTMEKGSRVVTLYPEKRLYPVAQMPTTEAAINNGVLRDLYVVIGDPQVEGGWAVRVYIKPFANWIWAGCIIMSLGGLVSLTDRRFRVAAGARRRSVQGPGKTVPAERSVFF